MNSFQNFIVVVLVLVASLVLFLTGHEPPATVALGAVLGAVGTHVSATKGAS